MSLAGNTEPRQYTIDTRPLCQGIPFLLTDAATPRLVLKSGSHFLVTDQSGQVPDCNTLGYGYYRYDTRHLSRWELYLNDHPVSVLSGTVEDGYAGKFIYTNVQTETTPQQAIIVHRETVLAGRLWERLTFENFHTCPIQLSFKLCFRSDFADIFEVRGINRQERGQRMMPLASGDGRSLFLAYRGLDGMLLETSIDFVGMSPQSIKDGDVTFQFELPVRQAKRFEMCVSTHWQEKQIVARRTITKSYFDAHKIAKEQFLSWLKQGSTVSTGHEVFNLSLERSLRDLYILRQSTPQGPGLAAGIPWFCSIMGRDTAITGLQVMPFLPHLSQECLELLAAYQGKKNVDYTREQPGRILSELRMGELARTKQIPFAPYYGSIDTTPLWLLLFCRYINWTGDQDLARQLWPRVKAALDHLKKSSRGPYLVYGEEGEINPQNQGWKDSDNAVVHADGSPVKGPVAMCEVQGYLYAAYKELARLASKLGRYGTASKLRGEAEELKEAFRRDFWIESEDFIALALDGDENQVKLLTSNPGHLLFSGILTDEQARAVANRLMTPDFQTGWGIRTVSGSSKIFSPVGYHTGAVWPHDNAIIASGMRRIIRISDVHQLMMQLTEVAQDAPEFRLPELSCGFAREEAPNSIEYPMACAPQAWAAASLIQLLSTCINFVPDALNERLRIVEPCLPEWLGKVTIYGLKVGKAEIDLCLSTRNQSTSCQILQKSGDIRVIVEG